MENETGNNLMQTLIQSLISQCDVMEVKTVAIFVTGEHFKQEKSKIFRQFKSVAGSLHSIHAGTKM